MHLLFWAIEVLTLAVSICYLWSKHVVAYEHCPGNMPLLDYLVGVPLLALVNVDFIHLATKWNVPADPVIIGSTIGVSITLYIAWRMGDKRNQSRPD
jgi:hypothetical protein